MIGISLEGGGAKGSYQVGVYKALKKHKVKPDIIVGTSIGAMNAALLVTNNLYKLKRIWLDVDSSFVGIPHNINISINKETVHFIKNIIENKGLNISKLEKLIENEVNEKRVRKSKIKYGLSTVNLSKFKEESLLIDDIKEGGLHNYILASSYLPVFGYKKLIDGNYYVDGGFVNNNPINILLDYGCTTIYSIEISKVSITKKVDTSNVNVITIKPTKDLGDFLNTTKEQSKRNMRLGYLDTLKVLEKLDGSSFYFKKMNDNEYLKIYNKYYKIHNKFYKKIIIYKLEEFMKKNNYDDLKIYNIKQIIRRNDGKSIFS